MSLNRSSTAVLALLISMGLSVVAAAFHELKGTKQSERVAVWKVVLTRKQDSDSLFPMRSAYELASSGERVNIYDEVIARRQVRFQYSTAALLPLAWWDAVCSRIPSCKPEEIRSVFWLLSVLSLALVVLLTGWLAWTSGADPPQSKVQRTVLFVACAGMAASFYPLVRAVQIGQVQVVLDALVLVLFWLWRPGQRVLCGIVAGLLAIYKPQYAVLLVWAIACQEYRFALVMAGSMTAAVLASIWQFGFTPYLDFLGFLAKLGSRGHAFYPNQSVNGLLNRALHTESWFEFNPVGLAPENKTVAIGTLLTSAFLLMWLLVWHYKRRKLGAGRVQLAIALLTLTLAAPVAWEHHFGFLPAVFVISLHATRTTSQKLLWILCYVLTSELFFYTTSTTVLNNILLSTLFLGALLLLGLLYRLANVRNDSSTSHAPRGFVLSR